MLGLALAAAMAAPTVPAPEPACISVPFAIAEAEKAGGHMIDLVPVEGANIDHLLVVVAFERIQLWGVHEGCMIGPIIPLDAVKSHGQPA